LQIIKIIQVDGMKKLVGLLLMSFTLFTAFAQKDYEEVWKKHTYTLRILEEKIRMLESNQRTQMENLQAQLLLLSAKDTVQQKQMLSTMQFYLEQSDKKISQEIEELKRKKDERKTEISQLVQTYTTNIQEQINQQASMLLFGGLGIIALCIMLFLVATKLMKDQQEHYLREFAHRQQADLRAIIQSSLQENLNREMQKYSLQNESMLSQNDEKDEWIALLQQKIFDLENKLKEREQLIEGNLATQSKEMQVNPVVSETENKSAQSENIEVPLKEEETIVTIAETTPNPNEVSTEPIAQKEEKEDLRTESEQVSLTTEKHEEANEKHDLVNNRDWVEAIEQKINQSLKESLEEEDVEEQVIYAKEETQEVLEANVYNPEYEEVMAKAMHYYEQRMFEEAIEYYGKAIALNPDYLAYTKRANCYHILKKYNQAAADYEKAIRIKKDFVPAYNNAIEIYILTDNFFQALTLLERLSQIEKSHSHKAVELYLKLIAQKGLLQNTEKTERELDALLRENFTFNFSVKEIEDWLITADIDATDKKLIRVKTELLKMKKEYATFA
jgi:tetratricopeptide (TPR) repeat protein